MENWRTISVKGVLISVSDKGRIKKLEPREKELAPFKKPGSCAYVRVFYARDKHCIRSVARLVIETFVGGSKLPRNALIKYLDGNVMNCSVDNLILPDRWP